MNLNPWVRQTHRWLSVVFTLAVLVNIAFNVLPQANEEVATWVGMATLLPLSLLLITGIYLFVLPHIRKKPNRTGTGA